MTIDQHDCTTDVTTPGAELAQLLIATTSVAHDPARFTDAELHAVYHAWNQLFGRAPELHAAVPEIFSFHQAVLTEFENRCWQDHGERGWAE